RSVRGQRDVAERVDALLRRQDRGDAAVAAGSRVCHLEVVGLDALRGGRAVGLDDRVRAVRHRTRATGHLDVGVAQHLLLAVVDDGGRALGEVVAERDGLGAGTLHVDGLVSTAENGRRAATDRFDVELVAGDRDRLIARAVVTDLRQAANRGDGLDLDRAGLDRLRAGPGVDELRAATVGRGNADRLRLDVLPGAGLDTRAASSGGRGFHFDG